MATLGDAVPAALGTPPATGKPHIRDDMPLYLRRLEQPTPLNTFIKLFVLTQPVTEAEARDAFAPLSVDQIEALGLLSRVSDRPQGHAPPLGVRRTGARARRL